jgi:2',3'-cyclic-nucleotide 2'-phosphodiesterase (5'-nucleotidase family)
LRGVTTFTLTLKTVAGIHRVKIEARDIAQAKALARQVYGNTVQQVTILP